MKDGYLYDINSLYPYAMMQELPIGNPKFINGNFNIDETLKDKVGFLYVRVECPDQNIPFLPFRNED